MAEKYDTGSGEGNRSDTERDAATVFDEKVNPPRARFRLHSIEGLLLAGTYAIHVRPSSKVESRQQFVVHQNVQGALSLNQDYLFPFAERVRIGLFRTVGGSQERLRVAGVLPVRFLSHEIHLRPEQNTRARHSVKFDDGKGTLISVTMEWWPLNEGQHVVIEARLAYSEGKVRVKYEPPGYTPNIRQ
ncbi:uncharacterized protein LOC100904234 [Galendromus occidentalis]|uniref:Uncharacterized protein LOC100904234 n=1 Tax=Galendromus occidentalis TaxID=34638 RepID=A0AAJ6VYL4_9ACAR|nr:uncharacterized protein LOC100904234 [Galendromus occidentalis]